MLSQDRGSTPLTSTILRSARPSYGWHARHIRAKRGRRMVSSVALAKEDGSPWTILKPLFDTYPNGAEPQMACQTYPSEARKKDGVLRSLGEGGRKPLDNTEIVLFEPIPHYTTGLNICFTLTFCAASAIRINVTSAAQGTYASVSPNTMPAALHIRRNTGPGNWKPILLLSWKIGHEPSKFI